MCFVKKLTVTCFVGSPVEINNRVHANQAWCPQFCVIERFCVESSKRSDQVRIYKLFIDRTFSSQPLFWEPYAAPKHP